MNAERLFDGEAWARGEAWQALEALRPAGAAFVSPGLVAVVGHAEAVRVLSEPTFFSSRFGTGRRRTEFDGRSLNLDDPPRSTGLRRTLPRLPEVEPPQALVAAFVAQGGGDFVEALARPFALAQFGRFVGLAEPLLGELGVLSRALASAGEAASFVAADQALLSWLSEHRDAPEPFFALGDDLDPRDRRYLQRLLAQTGHESTAMLLALAVRELLVRGLPFEASPAAVDELIRFTSPLIRFVREVVRPTSLGELSLEPGTRVAVFFPLVNRDPRVFARAEQLELERTPNPHLAFGAGPHACFGASFARAQLTAMLDALAPHAGRLRITAEEPLRSSVTRGWRRLELRLQASRGTQAR
ncbi:MAG: cytochrome P450 [Myxococcota bacterium]